VRTGGGHQSAPRGLLSGYSRIWPEDTHPLSGKNPETAADRTHTLPRRLCFEEDKAVRRIGEMNELQDTCLNIDRCLDIGDPRGFSRVSHELREVLSRMREHIDNISVADLTSRGTPERRL
jgi:hypothetical protein